MPIFSIASIASDMTRLSILKKPADHSAANSGADAQHVAGGQCASTTIHGKSTLM